MKLWLLKLDFESDNGFDLNDPDAKYYVSGYSHVQGFVVRAATERQAREMAASYSRSAHEPWWLDAEVSTCVALLEAGEPEIILADEPTG